MNNYTKYYVALAAFCCLACSSARAQYADDGFNPDAGNTVRAIAIQTNGNVLLGGDFITLGAVARPYVGRVLANGHLDTAFNPASAGAGPNGSVYAMVLQGDGKVLIGGAFATINGVSHPYVARLNTDGTLDAAYTPNANELVRALALQSDGKLLVGGDFVNLGGQVRNFIGRLNADGSLDTAFNPITDGAVHAIAVQPDGKIVVGGDFILIGGQTRNRLARLNADGSLDSTFVLTNGANSIVYALAIQADGKIVVGGGFTTMDAQARIGIARLNADGSLDAAFHPDTDNLNVYALAIQPDGKIVAGGAFTKLGGGDRIRIGRLNTDGTLDTTFISPGGALATVRALAVQADNSILAGGVFQTIGGIARSRIARLYPDGRTDQIFNPDAGSSVYSCALQADGNILVGGPFTTLNSPTVRNHIARLGNDGILDTAFNPGAGDSVYGLAVQTNGMIIVAGDFHTLVGAAPCLHLGRLKTDYTLDAAFTPAPNDFVYAMALQADGKLVVGGGFTTLTGPDRNRIGRLNADGSLDTDFNPGADGTVFSLAVQPDGKIIGGGNFATLGGQGRNCIGRLNADGSLDPSFVVTNADSTVWSTVVQSDGKIIVGGSFQHLGGQERKFIGRLNADGSLDTAFNPTLDQRVVTMVLQADGKILIGGGFSNVGAIPVARKYIARLNSDGTLDTTFDLSCGIGDIEVASLALQSDGKIIVGGSFQTIGGEARNRLARIANTEAALQNLSVNASGTAVTWLRTGTSPEVWRTTFEQSTDGSTWTYLGAGTRITNGWQLIGLSLPQSQNFYIRARGYGVSGAFGTSVSIYESIRLSYLTQTLPVVIITNASGVVTGYYGAVNYPLSGTNNANVSGTMWWNNSLGGSASFASANPWSVTITNLCVGANLITVYGSNAVGALASNSITIVQRRNDYLAADFDGDRLSDPAGYNGTNWYEWLSTHNYSRTNTYDHLTGGTFPVSADFGGDGLADPALYDNKTGNWYVWFSPLYWLAGPLPYGIVGAAPVPADFDGDRLADFAVYAAGSWYAWFSTAGYVGFGPFNFGVADAIPVAGDFDGDVKADPAIYLGGYWYAWLSSINYVEVSATVTGDPNAFPVTSDFDGDGLCDLATVNGGVWYARLSTAGYQELGPFTFNAEGWAWLLPEQE